MFLKDKRILKWFLSIILITIFELDIYYSHLYRMSSMRPKFVRRSDGSLQLQNEKEARRVAEQNRGSQIQARNPEKVKADALQGVILKGGSTSNRLHVLGQHKLQLGQYQGQTFQWVLENCLGYAGWLCDSMRSERMTSVPLSVNKFLFKEYTESFEEGREVIEMKKRQREGKSASTSRLTTGSSLSSDLPPLPPVIGWGSRLTSTPKDPGMRKVVFFL